MTLIELMISIVILGLIVGPLSAAMIVILRSTNQTTLRQSTFHDRNLVRTYMPTDITSALSSPLEYTTDSNGNANLALTPSLQTYDNHNGATNNRQNLCDGTTAAAAYGSSGILLFSLTWGEYTTLNTTAGNTNGLVFHFNSYMAEYYTQSRASGGMTLMRAYCSGTGDTATPSTLVNEVALADSFPAAVGAVGTTSGSSISVSVLTTGSPSGSTQALTGFTSMTVTLPDSSGNTSTYSFQSSERSA